MNRKSKNRSGVVKEYVTVAFAEDLDLARQYENLLAEHGICAVVKNQGRLQDGDFSGIAVMVPEEFLDEAYALISKEASYDDFFDAAFSEQSHGDLGDHDLLFEEDDDEYIQ